MARGHRFDKPQRAGRSSARLGVVGTVLMLAITGCASQERAPVAPLASSAPSAATTSEQSVPHVIGSRMMALDSGPVRVDLLSVDRSAADTVTVRWQLTNTLEQQVDAAGKMETLAFHPVSTVDGVSLVDIVGHKRYFPLQDTQGGCLCSAANIKIDPGRSQEFYAVFPALPGELRQIAVAVPLTPVFADVSVTDRPRAVGQDEVDPATADVKSPPFILPIINSVEGTEASIDDDDVNRRVRLSADVLFAVDKADLTSRARAVLEDVAEQIDASPGDVVEIDGHTDNTGNDAINDPLSQRRARAVQERLKVLATRQGVRYQSAGHGSHEAIADNATAEGRQKNRRVTVTFARPKPAVAPTSAPPAPAQPPREEDLPVLTTIRPRPIPNHLDTKGMKVEVNELSRSAGAMVQAVWTLSNTGDGVIGLAGWLNGDLFTYAGQNTSGAVLHDRADELLYRPLRDKSKGCLCTVHNSGKNTLAPGESATFFNLYEVPAELESVTLQIPGFAESQQLRIQ